MSKELTQEQCNNLHEALLEDFRQQDLDNEDPYIPRITCHKCDGRFACPFAYDIYNTDGDCLAEK